MNTKTIKNSTNNLFIIVFLLFSSYFFGQTTSIPDNNFEAYLESIGRGNLIPNDNLVFTANINTLVSLTVSNKNIADLTGIQDFSALQTLYCSNNQLTSLDLSQNTALIEIECENNQLSSLNVKNGNNTNVTYFNAITNPLLTCIEVDNATYSTANWFLLDATASFNNNCAIAMTSIPDANFEAYLEANGMGNGIANDQLVITSNINTVTNLNVFNNFISDLTGIEDFTALQILACVSNQLTNLDLSQNLSLTELYCNNNQLISLNVSSNTLLQKLYCQDNQLTILDLSPNFSLTEINCNTNNLNNLSVKNTSNLSIVSFDSRVNPNLLCIEVDDPVYSTTNWLFIDSNSSFSSNCSGIALTAIPDANFENYLESNGMGNGIANDNIVETNNINAVANLNIGNLNITDLTGIEDFVGLQNLNCSNNQIINLNLSQNGFLTSLNCSNNSLESLNVQNGNNTNVTTANFNSSNNPNLSCIQVDNLSYSNSNWTNIDINSSFSTNCHYFETNIPDATFENYLETHDINGNMVSIGDSTSLGNGVANDAYVTTSKIAIVIELDVSHPTNLGTIVNLIGLEDFTALSILNCSGNQITNLNTSSNTVLTVLNCGNNDLVSLGLSQNTLLERLTCDANLITILNLSQNTALQYLSCSNNPFNLGLDLSTLTDLRELICQSNTLTSLNLSTNLQLTTLLCNLNDLTNLNVTNNTLLKGINCSENTLIGIDLSQNNVLDNFVCYNNDLASLDLSQNTALTYLDCSGNPLGSLNIKNGNNSNISNANFNATNNASLTCIEVDDVTYSSSNWSQIDAQSFFSTNCALVGLTQVPDINFENYLETHNSNGTIVSVGDPTSMGNGIAFDGLVTTAKINIVTVLDVSNLTISNLTGIEDFTALVDLNCFGNNLGNLDLSSNTNLGNLNCANNSLTNLNLNQNTGLTTLNCQANLLATLTMPTSTLLTELICNNNQLTQLNVNASTGIQTLNCNNNQLTTLAINFLSNLINLDCKNNFITQLYLSQNLNLKTISCSNNVIKEINLEQNPLVTSFDCSSNQLDVLNIKNGANVNLVFFDATSNNLSCIEVDDVIYADANFTNIDITASFSQNCHFFETYVPNDNFEHFLETHDANGNLVVVGGGNSMGNGIDYDDYVATSAINSVTILDIASQSISDLTGIENFIALQSLTCDTNQLTSLDITNLTALTFLDCSYNLITAIDLSHNIALENLNIFHNALTALDVNLNVNLKVLECSSNQISSLSLINNSNLLILRSAHNQLSNLLLTNNPLLNQVLVSFNNLTDVDVNANSLLTWLEVNDNQLTQLFVKNGNNTILAGFDARNNPNLTCIEVDDVIFALNNWLGNIDPSASFNLNCHYGQTYVPDDNFEQTLIDLGYDFGTLDDYVPTANIDSVTTLNLENKNIADLTGLEDFIALEILYASNNVFSSIDLTGNSNLKELYVLNGLLNDLDVSQNVLLTYLDCQNNTLVTLNVQNGNNSNFTYFRAINNPQLSCIQVDNIAYSTTNWTLIDSTSNFNIDCHYTETYIPDTNFEHYLETHDASGLIVAIGNINSLGNGIDNDNYVTTSKIELVLTLNISNLNISDLTGISAFIDLLQLDCSNNALTNLELGNNTNLSKLFCNDNQINNLDITNNPFIFNLNCSSNNLTSLNLTNNIDLLVLNCFFNQLSSLNLLANTSLEILQCYQNNLVSLDVSQNTFLVSIECSRNQISSIDVTSNNLLENLYCSKNQLTNLDVVMNSSLVNIDCSYNQLLSLNVKNGNNANFTSFKAFVNPNLTCIEVDNITIPSTPTWQKDAGANYSTNCGASVKIWEFGQWTNGVPTLSDNAILRDDYFTSSGNIEAKTLTIESGIIAIIFAGDYVKLQGNLINNGSFIVGVTGSFVQIDNNATNTGSGLYEVDVETTQLDDKDRFTYFSSPCSNTTLGQVFNDPFNQWVNLNKLYSYNSTTQQWEARGVSNAMLPAIGYAVQPHSNNTFPLIGPVYFTGSFNNGEFTQPLVYNSGGVDDDNILVGNPYPSAIDATMLLNQNTGANAFYFWTHKSLLGASGYLADDYAIWNNVGGIASASGATAPTGYIASGQGFFVEANATAGNFTFNNAMRVTNNNTDFRTVENNQRDKIWVNLTNNQGYFSQVLLAFITEGSNGFDATYDASRLNAGSVTSFYTIGQNNEHFGIESRGLITEEQTIPLGIDLLSFTTSNFTIGIDHFENLENIDVFIKDNLHNVIHDLKQRDFNFLIEEIGEYNNRFELILRRNALEITDAILENELIVKNINENEISIKMKNGSVINQLKAYTVLGKMLINAKPNSTDFNLKTTINQGTVLFFQVVLENGKTISKKFLKL